VVSDYKSFKLLLTGHKLAPFALRGCGWEQRSKALNAHSSMIRRSKWQSRNTDVKGGIMFTTWAEHTRPTVGWKFWHGDQRRHKPYRRERECQMNLAIETSDLTPHIWTQPWVPKESELVKDDMMHPQGASNAKVLNQCSRRVQLKHLAS